MGTVPQRTGRSAGKGKPAQKRTRVTKQRKAPARPKAVTQKKSWSIDQANWSKFHAYLKRKNVKSESAIVSQALGRFVDEEIAKEEREKAAAEYFSSFETKDLELSPAERAALLAKWQG